MIRDLKFAFRQLFKAPAFMISAITVLALGIGVNTAVFTLVDTLFFAPPAYAKPHEMVQLFSQDKKDPKKFRGFSYPTYLDIREQNTVFSDVMGFNVAFIGLGQKGDTRRAFGAIVTSNYFSVLGVEPLIGRFFTQQDAAAAGQDPYAVLSYDYWQRRFAGNAGVLGTPISLYGTTYTIIGVAPLGFRGETVGENPDLWLPTMMEPMAMKSRHFATTGSMSRMFTTLSDCWTWFWSRITQRLSSL
jgi:hypothetical protein